MGNVDFLPSDGSKEVAYIPFQKPAKTQSLNMINPQSPNTQMLRFQSKITHHMKKQKDLS